MTLFRPSESSRSKQHRGGKRGEIRKRKKAAQKLRENQTIRFQSPSTLQVEEEGGSTRVCTMAVDSLKCYNGSTLVYVGVGGAELEDFCEGESGEGSAGGDVTAGPQFRHMLDKEWRKVKQVALPNWPTCHDDLSVWTRRVRVGAKVGGGSLGQSWGGESARGRQVW